MRKWQVQARVQELARNRPQRVYLTSHAKVRDPLAGKFPLLKQEVLTTLVYGHVADDPVPDLTTGGWKFKSTRAVDDHVLEVVGVIVADEDKIVVITGYENRPIQRGRASPIGDHIE